MLGGFGAAALAYWQVVLAEGAYMGPWAVRLIYRLGAPHYDRVHAPWQVSADALLLPWLDAALTDLPRPRILDIATGTGRLPHLLRYRYPHARLAALDLTPHMLTVARTRWAQTTPSPDQAPPAEIAAPLWHVGEASQLPWAKASFDLVACLEALEYLPSPRRALAEWARVTRPGGSLLLSKVPDATARLLPGRALDRVACVRALHAAGWTAIQIHPWQPGHYELVTARREGYV